MYENKRVKIIPNKATVVSTFLKATMIVFITDLCAGKLNYPHKD